MVKRSLKLGLWLARTVARKLGYFSANFHFLAHRTQGLSTHQPLNYTPRIDAPVSLKSPSAPNDMPGTDYSDGTNSLVGAEGPATPNSPTLVLPPFAP